MAEKRKIRERVEQLLEIIDMSGFEKRAIQQLSGGRKATDSVSKNTCAKPGNCFYLMRPSVRLMKVYDGNYEEENQEVTKRAWIYNDLCNA